MSRINIAIDGPAGSGKSTAAKNISKALGIIYLDTGAMYRAVALKAVRTGMDARDEESLAALVKNIDIRVEYEENNQRILLDGEDVTGLIRTPEISRGASDVSAFPAVRLRMVELQRRIADEHDVVMDGRDIGTFVLPGAKYKFYLTASIEERARRRYEELKANGASGITLEDVKRDIALRDENDSSRAFAPLAKAPDALEIDTTCLNPQEVADKILSFIKINGQTVR